MKKNIAMRIAAFLFVLTMISTCAFATTFAKYTTKGEATDEARVAKWGVTVTAQKPDNTEYEFGGSTEDGEIIIDANTKTLAPGSRVKFACLQLEGTPEVKVAVTYTAELKLEGWKLDDDSSYCPLIFHVGSTDYYIGKDATITDVATLITAVQNAIIDYSEEYATGTNLKNQPANTLTVTCSWDFNENGNSPVDFQLDANDTYLGNLNPAPTVSLKITCTVTQID